MVRTTKPARVLPFAVEMTAVKVRSEYIGTKRKRPTRKKIRAI